MSDAGSAEGGNEGDGCLMSIRELGWTIPEEGATVQRLSSASKAAVWGICGGWSKGRSV